jgi:ABC-type Fe3+ transport system permease subunit
MGLVFEFYVNFGTYGVIVGMLIVGLLVGYADRRAGAELRWGTDMAFARWFLIGTFLIVVGASLIEVVPGIALAMAWTIGLKRLFHETFDDSDSEGSITVIVDAPES